MHNSVFNLKEFWIWVFYACLQAFMILMLCFWTAEDTVVDSGKNFTFWAGGHHVYMNCVLLANIIILKMQHAYTGVNMFIIICQIACFFFLLWYFSVELQTDVIYQFMDEFTSSKTAWLGCFFVVSSLWTIDYMLHALRLSLAYMFAGKNQTKAEIL